MNRFILSLCILLIAIGALLYIVRPIGKQTNTLFTVVTTFHPVTMLVQPLAGESVTVKQLVSSGQEMHDYHVKPSDLETLKSADLLIVSGAGLESGWLDSLLASVKRSDLRIIALADVLKQSGTPLLQLSEEGDAAITTDPHIWLSPKNALVVVPAIRDALTTLDPEHTSSYTTNADSFISELMALDAETEQRLATFSQKKFIAFHDAFHYFARDYGLTQVATIELAPGQAPSPGQLTAVRQLVTTHGLKALFTEPQFSSKTVDQLAQDLGIKVLPLDPLETGSDAETYPEAMRRNLDSLAQALQ